LNPAAIEFVTVGNPGNPDASPDASGVSYGGVDYIYRIGKYEVTYGQYLEFLNAKAKSDPTGLYDPSMGDDKIGNGILRTGVSGSYSYSLIDEISANRPVNYVNFKDAARFVNWYNNGKGNSSTEDGAYLISTVNLKAANRVNGVNRYAIAGPSSIAVGDQIEISGFTGVGFDVRSQVVKVEFIDGTTYISVPNKYPDGQANGEGVAVAISPTHSASAKYWIPSEDEWTKAAYYNPNLNGGSGGYFTWATQSNEHPGNSSEPIANQANIPSPDGTKTANAYVSRDITPFTGPNLLTPVGNFSKSPSFYGTFDQDGNVTEWTETVYDATAAFGNWNNSPNATRAKHGAMYYSNTPGSSRRDDGLMPNDKGYATGFRLASVSGDHDHTKHQVSSSNPSSTKPKVAEITSPKLKLSGPAVFGGPIEGFQEVWRVFYPAFGEARLVLNEEQTKIDYEFKITGLDFGIIAGIGPTTENTGDDVNGMHIHHSPPGAVGDPALAIINPNEDSDTSYRYDKLTGQWTIAGSWSANDPSSVSFGYNLENYLFQGLDYLNIHNEDVPLGVIRSQFLPLNDIAKAGQPLAFQRFYNPVSGTHLYSTDSAEIASLTGNGWISEGLACNLYQATSITSGRALGITPKNLVDVHRLYNSQKRDYLYTIDTQELLSSQRAGYNYEGVVGSAYLPSAAGNGLTVMQRFYNGSTGVHFYTNNASEASVLAGLGFIAEGAAWAS
jgi:formylglycine-generating enzyme required for sulfatase activity